MQWMYGHATGLRALATEIYSSLVSRQETLAEAAPQMRTAVGPTLLDEAYFRAVVAAQGRQDTQGAVEGQQECSSVLLAESLAHVEPRPRPRRARGAQGQERRDPIDLDDIHSEQTDSIRI